MTHQPTPKATEEKPAPHAAPCETQNEAPTITTPNNLAAFIRAAYEKDGI